MRVAGTAGAANLQRKPVTTLAQVPQSSAQSAHAPAGEAIIPNAYEKSLKPLWAHTQDHITRQTDSACGVTASTKSFALYLPDGLLLNLDEGGNTLAFAALQSTERGQALLNGTAGTSSPPPRLSPGATAINC